MNQESQNYKHLWNFKLQRGILNIKNQFASQWSTQKKIAIFSIVLLTIVAIPFLNTAFGIIIAVGDGPIELQLVESLNLLFVTNQISNTVSIIDTISETVINTVPVGTSPISPAYVSSTSLLYVSNQASNDVSVIDVSTPATASVITTIPVGTAPFNVNYNSVSNQIYVANCFSNDVSVIDVNSASGTFNTVIKTIPVGICPTGLKVNDSSNKIYVSNTFGNTVSVIDGNTDSVVSTINVIGPGGIGIDKINNRIAVSNAFSNAISLIDGANDSVLQTITVGNEPRNIEFNSITNQILVANHGDGTVSIIDGTSLNVLGAVPVGSTPHGMEVSTTNVIYVANQDSGTVTTFDIGANVPPTANAGPDQIVNEGDNVQLDGTASSDFDGDPITFQWTQTDGPNVILSSLTSSNPTFTAPDVSGNSLFEFQLIVNDGIFNSIPDFVNVIVKDITIFQVPLNFVGSQLEGDIIIDEFPADNQITLDIINPGGATQGKLEDVKITSTVSGSNVEFDFIADIEEPDTVPPLLNTALYYDIENTVIDFSNPANFAKNNFPLSQFSIDKTFDAGDNFSDGCPIVGHLVLEEENNQWASTGDPRIPNTNKLYVVDSIGNQIFVVDGNTNEIITSIGVGELPRGLVFDPTLNKLYVTNLNSGTVSVINTLTNTVEETIPVLGAAAIGIDTTTKKVYVPSFGLGTITVIDANTDTIIDTIVTSGTNLSEIVINTDLKRLYVTDGAANTLIVVDAITNNEIISTALGGIPGGMIINPNNNSVYIAIFTANSIVVFDEQANTITENIPVGIAPVGVGINSLTNKIFVSNAGAGTVSVIDGSINVEIQTIALLPSILGLSVNENTDRVFVVNQAGGTISILDGSKMTVLDSVALSPGIFTMTINDLVSNPVRDPSNDVIDLGTNEILECAYIAKLPHLSKFAVGGVASLFLGGLGGGAGSGALITSLSSLSSNRDFFIPNEIEKIIENFDPHVPLAPMDPNSFEDFEFPLTIKHNPYNGYPLAGYENTIETNIVKVGTPITLEFMFYGQTELQHFSLYSDLYGSKSNPSESNLQILYNKDKDLEILDPLDSVSDVKVTKNNLGDKKIQIVVEFTPTKEYSITDLIARAWTPSLSSSDIIIRDAFEIIPSVDDESIESTYEEPIIEEIKSQNIPKWIKNNAGWWADQQISQSDFISGIEYLIKNGIINVPGVEVESNSLTSEIPEWIQNNAGWWAESLITDDDFIEAMQWLIAQGVIQI